VTFYLHIYVFSEIKKRKFNQLCCKLVEIGRKNIEAVVRRVK
jgi:hypothetical protein